MDTNWEIAKFEYEKALDLYKTYTTMRRQDLVYMTIIQVGAFTVLKDAMFNFAHIQWIIAIIGFFLCLVGWNNEVRLATYLRGALDKVKEIERNTKLDLINSVNVKLKNEHRFIYKIHNGITLYFYYLILACSWVYFLLINIFYKY